MSPYLPPPLPLLPLPGRVGRGARIRLFIGLRIRVVAHGEPLQVSRSLLCRRPEDGEGNCVVGGVIAEKTRDGATKQAYPTVLGVCQAAFTTTAGVESRALSLYWARNASALGRPLARKASRTASTGRGTRRNSSPSVPSVSLRMAYSAQGSRRKWSSGWLWL